MCQCHQFIFVVVFHFGLFYLKRPHIENGHNSSSKSKTTQNTHGQKLSGTLPTMQKTSTMQNDHALSLSHTHTHAHTHTHTHTHTHIYKIDLTVSSRAAYLHININIYIHIYSRGQKYRHPCNYVRKSNTSLRKLFQLQKKINVLIHVLIVFVCTVTTQENLRRKVELDKISHRTKKWTGQNYWQLEKIVRNICFSSM